MADRTHRHHYYRIKRLLEPLYCRRGGKKTDGQQNRIAMQIMQYGCATSAFGGRVSRIVCASFGYGCRVLIVYEY